MRTDIVALFGQHRHTHVRARYYRGLGLAALGQFGTAIGDFTFVINNEPDIIEAYYNRAFCYEQRYLFIEALEDYDEALEKKPDGTAKVGLLGMEMAREKELGLVVSSLLEQGCQLSFSSLRADILSESLIRLLAKSNLKTVALAPDGCSERLRKVINKGITRKNILESAKKLVEAGIVNLKLYFMIGLPTETEKDLDLPCYR